MKEVFLLTIPTNESVTFQDGGLFFTHSFEGVYTAQFDDLDGVHRCMEHLRSGKIILPNESRIGDMYIIFSERDGSKKSNTCMYLNDAVVQKVQRV